MPTITLQPPAKISPAYPIVIGRGTAAELPQLLSGLTDVDRVIVLHDEAVAKPANALAKTVKAATVIGIPSGETSKTLPEIESLCAQLLKAGATRRTVLVSVGGGMVSDLVGFLASIYMRGMRVIHVPTSMLAMVDAGLGGKTAVDAGDVKNMLGTIHHPVAIVVDTAFLETLPDLQLKEGLVEVVKMAAMLDAETFAWLEENMTTILKRDEAAVIACLERAVRMKADTVSADDHDHGRRLFLNFGHTVGHAVEALSHFAISHGQAVSIGMMCEMRMAKMEGADRVEKLLCDLQMPLAITESYTTDALWNVMKSDKKNVGKEVRITVPVRIGEGVLRAVTLEEFTRARHP